MKTPTEPDLIDRCRRGSAAAFEPLVRMYEREALVIAEGYLLDRDDAADAVQDAFVRAYRSLGRLTAGSAFGPWFRTILRNLCRDRLQSVARRGRQSWSDDDVSHQVWQEPVAAGAIEREEFAQQVRGALAHIASHHREVLVLKEIEEMSYAEIAAELNIAPGTVASRIFHARAALKQALLAAGISAGDVA